MPKKPIEYNGVKYGSRKEMFAAVAKERGVAYDTVRSAYGLGGLERVDRIGRGMGGGIPTVVGSFTFKTQDDVAKHFKVSPATVATLKKQNRLNTLLHIDKPLNERNMLTARASAKRLAKEIEDESK